MAELHPDILQQILKRLNVKDLIKFKTACKSWKSLISSAGFIRTHLNYNYNINNNYNDVDTRIVMARRSYRLPPYEVDDGLFDCQFCHLLGSSNGLVCVNLIGTRIVVANPSTREVKTLKSPRISYTGALSPLIWGFGYDSCTDDYKVMSGFKKDDDMTCFKMLNLKSNVWKVIGDVKYSIVSRIGILYNGALHWVMKDASSQDNKKVILSFCLSKEEFKEIPQPDDERYKSDTARYPTMRLGIMEECLCVFRYDIFSRDLWMMKNYNVKKTWGMVRKDRERQVAINYMKRLQHYIPHKESLCHDMGIYRTWEFVGAPIYVQSLVSPHINGKPNRKRKASNRKKCSKLIKEDPSVLGPSG